MNGLEKAHDSPLGKSVASFGNNVGECGAEDGVADGKESNSCEDSPKARDESKRKDGESKEGSYDF